MPINHSCECRCHAGKPSEYCCPECEPEQYETCDRCGQPRYAHNFDEREGTPGACDAYDDEAENARMRTAALEAAGQLRIPGS